jgi:hypothetical protein
LEAKNIQSKKDGNLDGNLSSMEAISSGSCWNIGKKKDSQITSE